jgi:hypothetical protein
MLRRRYTAGGSGLQRTDEAVERTGRRCRAAAGGGDATADSTTACGIGAAPVLKFLNRKGKAGQETTEKQVLMR